MSLAALVWALLDAPVDDPTDVLILAAVADRAGPDDVLHHVPTGAHAKIARVARTDAADVAIRLDRMVDRGVIDRVDLLGEMYRANIERVRE